MSNFVSIGKILNFHGIKGEAKVGYTQSQREFLLSLSEIYMKQDNEYKLHKIISIKSHKNVLLIKFEGINSIDEIIPLKGQLLFVNKQTIRETLQENEFLIDELVGLVVIDKADNKKLGFVIGVSNNGASDLISVKTNSQNISLIPFVKAIVPDVDIKNKKLYINNIEGLLE